MSDSTHGIVLQNAGSGSLDGGIATFGQVFLQGEVPAGAALIAQGGGISLPVQMDVKTRYEDGSVKMAVLAVQRPDLAAGESLELTFATEPAKPGGPTVNLNAALNEHSFLVEMKIAGGSTIKVDVMDVLRDALADGSASFWQSGPLATQARVSVDLPGAQRMVFDVTAFEGGGMTVEAQFNNDKAMGASGGRVQYDLTVTMDGAKVATETVSQGQYQNWHRSFSSNDHDGGQGLGSPSEGWLNIRHDVEYLSKTGAIAAYDTSLGISDTLINSWAAAQSQAGWSAPLAANGITQYMPMTGGRGDIGITTASNTAWLLTGDPYAAGYAMGQAEGASAIPWHFWNAGKDTWINSADFPKLWTDGRGGTGTVGDANATGLTQQVPNDTGWTPDRAHQPSLSYVPYLLTGERWILDNLQAQANFTVISLWPAVRTEDGAFIAPQQQARSVAWSIREVQNAAWSSPDGSPEQAYLQGVADANWKWLVEQIPAWTALQGEAHGWVPNVGGAGIDMSPWQQDYIASTAIAAASRGNEDAMTFLEWQMNFLIGRFQAAGEGFALRDGAAYIIAVGDGSNVYKSWADIGAATAARGWSNGTDSWAHSNGDYARLALMTLAGIYELTGSREAYDAYKALLAQNPPNISESTFAGNPNHAVTIPELYDSWAGTGGTPIVPPTLPQVPSQPAQPITPVPPSTPTPPVAVPVPPPVAAPSPVGDSLTLPQPTQGGRFDLGAGNNNTLNLSSAGANKLTVLNAKTITGGNASDDVTLATTITNGRIDLGAGSDKLTLSSSGANKLVVLNTETIIGGAGNDDVTLGTTFAGGTIDLGGGQDRLVLANGSNRITVANTETIISGTGHDDVTLAAAVTNATIDLGGGSDKLTLSSAGANKLVVLNTETITGGTASDDVTLGTAITNGRIDLGGGSDKLTLSSAGANKLVVLNTETITGDTADDDVTLGTVITNGRIDLGGGSDKLTLSSTGSNKLVVLNVETILGGARNDDVTLGAPITNGRIDLGGGSDKLTLSSSGANKLVVLNTASITGGTADDDVTLGSIVNNALVDLAGGQDRLVLANGSNRITVANTETIIGGTGNDDVILGTAVADGRIDLGGGSDKLTLSSAGANKLVVLNTESLIGGTANDDVTLGTAITNGRIDLGGGSDQLTLSSAGANRLVVLNTATIAGGSADDDVTLGTVISNGRIDLGGGSDRLILSSAGANKLAILNVETILGGGGNDDITLGAAITNGRIDLGGGSDRLTLSSSGANKLAVLNTEIITGGSANDDVALRTNVNGALVDLAGGQDRLVLADGSNRLTVANTETIIGGSGNDHITLSTAITNGRIDLGGGSDRLTLSSAGVNKLVVLNTESVIGGNANDDITFGTTINGGIVNLGAGSDSITLSSAGANKLTVLNTESITGGSAIDHIIFGTTITNGRVDLGAGHDTVILSSVGANKLTVTNVESVIGGNHSDHVTVLGSGAAHVASGAGNDVLIGGGGNDTLIGGSGTDTMTGGAGADHFIFNRTGDSILSAPDRVTDFGAGSDKLVFDDLLKGSFVYRGDAGFTGKGNTEARFADSSQQLILDVNGDGRADMAIILDNVVASTLGASDFIWS